MKEKKVIIESRWRIIPLLVISWGFVIMAIIGTYLPGLIFFGLCALFFTYPLLNPNNRVIYIGTKAYQAHIKEQFQKSYDELGIFEYGEGSFMVQDEDRKFYWTDIISIFAYKADHLVVDEIALQLFCEGDTSLTFSEKTPGWYQFTNRMNEQLPLSEPDWLLQVTSPAFATNLTLVYDKEGRSLQELTEKHYGKSK